MIDIMFIVYKIAIIRKYTLAILENYSNKFIGKNVKIVYLLVEILLSFRL